MDMGDERCRWRQREATLLAELGECLLWTDLSRRLGARGLLEPVPLEDCEGQSLSEALMVIEELAKVNPVAAWPVFLASIGPARVVRVLGSEEQQRRVLPGVTGGELGIAGTLTGPGSSSMTCGLTVNARVDGETVVLNGCVQRCVAARYAQHYVVYVRWHPHRDFPGIGAVVLGRTTPGLAMTAGEPPQEMWGVAVADLWLDDVHVSADAVLAPGVGSAELLRTASVERLGYASMAVAAADAAMDQVTRHLPETRPLGEAVLGVDAVLAALTDMAIQLGASHELITRAADIPGHSTPRDAAIAKSFATKVARNVCDLVLRVESLRDALRGTGP